MKKTKEKSESGRLQLALRQLLVEGKAGTHEEICQALETHGFTVNQPRISRLLHKLGAVKVVDHDGKHRYMLPHEHGLIHELNFSGPKTSALQWIIDIASNNHLIVIHTTPGAASFVAREIDLHQSKLDVLGSIAGDDTIFVAPKEVSQIKQTIEKIKAALT
jgi:transcriptional regulator of arginine metabolism